MTNAPSFPFEGDEAVKRHAPATERNRDAIIDILRECLPQDGTVLEIASGTGQHAICFARAFSYLQWQPSDYDAASLASIDAWRKDAALDNLNPSISINVMEQPWAIDNVDAILCINMVHISPWAASIALFEGAGAILAKDAPLYLYGPYFQNGVSIAQSNIDFDQSLRTRNRQWGIRDLDDIVALARQHGFHLESNVDMPANNLSLVFKKN